MTTQNRTNTLTNRVILSHSFEPELPTSTSYTGIFPSPAMGQLETGVAGPSHYQDNVADQIMDRTYYRSADGGITSSLAVGNEFELDVENLTHTWQTVTAPIYLPGTSAKQTNDNDGRSSAQFTALTLDLGMMREIISIQGVLIDRDTHPSSTSGHHIRRQHLLDIARTQWVKVHNFNRATGFDWDDPNRLPALTIGPMSGRKTQAEEDAMPGGQFPNQNLTQRYTRDSYYEGDEPSDDPRGTQVKGYTASGQSVSNLESWDWTFNYKGRRRYRGMIRRLTLTLVAGQPDVWRYTFDFEIVKNELQLRTLNAELQDQCLPNTRLWQNNNS